MELISLGSRPSYIGSIHILSRFQYAPPDSLSLFETSAFSNWFLALFEETLCSPIAPDEVGRALGCRQHWWKGFGYDVCDIIEIALPTPFDTARLREIWVQSENREAHLRLACATAFGVGAEHFCEEWSPSERAASARAQWFEWFTHADHREKLTRAFERETDPLAQELLLSAI